MSAGACLWGARVAGSHGTAGSTRTGRGVTVVEILIGMAVALALLAGMSNMVVGSRQTSRTERQLQEMQAIGRVAMELVGREVRKAGFRLSRDRALAEVFPAAGIPFTTASAVVGPAAAGLTVRFQGGGDAWSSDCLGNVVGAGQDVWQALWWQGGQLLCNARNLTTNSNQTMALIPQIEAMDLGYGIDDDGDGFADAYRAAAAVADWSRVVTVNVQIRVLSSEDSLADKPQPYMGFDGVAVTPNDRRLRRNYATVVALRNVLP